MNTQASWKMTENDFQITFARLNGHGVVVIQKIPEVDVHTIKVMGYTYSVKASIKGSHWQRFYSLPDAMKAAKARMEQFS